MANKKEETKKKTSTKKVDETKVEVNKTTKTKQNSKKQPVKSTVKPTDNKIKKTEKKSEGIKKVESSKTTKTKKEEPKKKEGIKNKEENKIEKVEQQKEEIKVTIEEPKVQEIKKDNNKIIGIFEKVVILVAVALVFSLLGYFIGSKSKDKTEYETATKDLEVFIEQYNKVLNEYYEDVDKNKLIKGAIDGMLSTLDGYSQVIDDSSNNFTITLEGSYEGLGVEVINDSNGNVVVYNVYEDTPAGRAGLKVNDIITKINDMDLKNVSTSDFVKKVSETDEIKLTVTRGSKELTFDMKKEFITLKSVSSEMLKNNVGYIKVDLFANNTQSQFKEALESLEKQNMKSLIIDLRDNTGGHLNTVKEMLSLFLDSSHVIYQTQSKTETLKFYSNGNENKSYKIVVLQNEASASASEIMASALRDNLNAYIIGKTSYGKGTVQQLETVEGFGQYKFTTKKWLTSKGEWINEKGLVPDLEVSQTEEYYKKPSKTTDDQLQEAIKYLTKK